MPMKRKQAKTPEASAPWTTRRLLEWMTGYFRAPGLDSPRVMAEMLLSHVIGCERIRLYMEADRPASAEELSRLRELVARAGRHEPVQYLVGHAWFFSRRLDVNASTLIPRPSTETLVEHVIQWLRSSGEGRTPTIADIGTGSGCIAVSVAAQVPRLRVLATDIVAEALQLARANARRHGVEGRIEFLQGGLLEPLRAKVGSQGLLDAICSNPPYVSDVEWADLPRNVRDYEPSSALRGGRDGLDFIRPLVAGAAPLLRPGGQLLIEIADSQHDSALALVDEAAGLENARVLKDHEDLWRVLVAQKSC